MSGNGSDVEGGNKTVQIAIGVIVIAGLIAFAAGPVRGWVTKAKKYSAKAGLKNIRGAYSAFYSQKSRYPNDDLSDLLVKNGGNIADWPVEPFTGTPAVTTTFTGTGGYFHDTQAHDVFLNLKDNDYFGEPYRGY